MAIDQKPSDSSLIEKRNNESLVQSFRLSPREESEMEELVQVVAEICEVPVSILNVIGSDKQWLKVESEVSLAGGAEIDFFHVFKKDALHDFMMIEDTRLVPEFLQHPFLKQNPFLVFLAEVPLADSQGNILGSICIFDTKTRILSPKQINALQYLAKQAAQLLILRMDQSTLVLEQANLIQCIDSIAPFYLHLDDQDVIISAGTNFLKNYAGLDEGMPFSKFFCWQSGFSSEKLLKSADKHERLLFFETIDKKNKFKCSVRKYTEKSYFVFSVPVINTIYPITAYNVNINNFPRHDYIAEYLFLQQSATKGLMDAQKLNQLITEKNKKLEDAKNTLVKINATLEERINQGVKKIRHLALFPEQNPNPVIEISADTFEAIYLNPSAKRLLGLDEEVPERNLLLGQLQIDPASWVDANDGKIEITIQGKIFERNLFYNKQFNSLRLYLHDITAIRLKELEERRKIDLFLRNQESLNNIRKLSEQLSLEDKFKYITKTVAETIRCDRCSIWLSDENLTAITTRHVYISNEEAYADGLEIKHEVAPSYFEALAGKNPILATNAFEHQATHQFTEIYLKPLGISSMLDIPLLQGEFSIGVICCEYFSPKDQFDSDTIAFCSSVADFIVLACETDGLLNSQKELELKNNLLKENMEQIIAMQSEIVEREKLATLGMLIAGIAHEINSPLGAIKASSEYLHKIFIDSFLNTIKHMTPEVISQGLILFSLRNTDAIATSTRDIRRLQKELYINLSQSWPQIENSNFYCRVIMDLGLHNNLNILREFISNPYCNQIFSFTHYLLHIYKSVSTISLAANRAGSVVKALNTFSHGNVESDNASFNLYESFSSVITLLWSKIKYTAVIENNVPRELLINGNVDELSQVWTNIINNALQASDNKCKIWIDYQMCQTSHVIVIGNNGPPIPDNIVPKIFDAFFSTKKRGEGTGLGLNIVRKIIEKHGGEISCKSEDHLTSFKIKLPA